jgi:hypothetical protein
MGKDRIKWEHRKRAKITEANVPELRIKNPTLEEYLFVATLAQQGTRSIPDQLRLIIKEYKKQIQQQ